MIAGASPVVQLVMLLLFIVSMISWAMIGRKYLDIKSAGKAADDFESRFWSGKKMSDLYEQVGMGRQNSNGMAAIFEAGFREYVRLRKQGNIEPQFVLEGAQRTMRVALSR